MPNAEYDYVVVGSGAGGAPLAARLARRGFRVLVLEAGGWDQPRVAEVPALHALSTEDPALSWAFYVHHYSDENREKQDSKYEADKKGVFYPRAATVGGCTMHNAMITVTGPASDWDQVAQRVGDPSWSAEAMREYFKRVERCTYRPDPGPDRPDPGDHGYHGWLTTSWPDVGLALGDKELLQVLLNALRASKAAGIEGFPELLHDFLHGRLREHFDPNDVRTQRRSPEGLALIPTAIRDGRRCGPRQLLEEVRQEVRQQGRPDDLTIETDALVTEILFEQPDGRPRAVGVKYLKGKHLYQAHPEFSHEPGETREVRCRREVILCGGAFNTPQLLLLSGIGPREELDRHGISVRVALPGVGRNLQDRYEVGVIWEMDREFDLLKGASFRDPDAGAEADPALKEWEKSHTGVYATNGAVLGILKKSHRDLPNPDLFLFALPGYFRGYHTGYSRDVASQKNVLTWAILKAYTSNHGGTVTLTDTNPRERPVINFRSFHDGAGGDPDGAGGDPDARAIVEAIKFIRTIQANAAGVVRSEILPGGVEDDDAKLEKWVRKEAWGHHACGTCRMGRRPQDGDVVDSNFRVHGVDGLRVVDASVFADIPGYFVVSHIYMISEKAADVIAAAAGAEAGSYPHALKEREQAAIRVRRQQAGVPAPGPAPAAPPPDGEEPALGLALSGGGIRSATFNLGILQALARRGLLRTVDYLSTVSGGGYIGGFLGRLFTRFAPNTNAAERVEQILRDSGSQEVAWLRQHSNYLSTTGRRDYFYNLGIYLNSLLALHFVLGILLFGFYGILNLLRYWALPALRNYLTERLPVPLPGSQADLPLGHLIMQAIPDIGHAWSPWFMLVEVLLLVAVLPLGLAFWSASHEAPRRYSRVTLTILFLVAAVLLFVGLSGGGVAGVSLPPLLGVVPLLAVFFWTELAWCVARRRAQLPVFGGGAPTPRVEQDVANNRLAYWLGWWLWLTGLVFFFALVDTAGLVLYRIADTNRTFGMTVARMMTLLVALLSVLRGVAGMTGGVRSVLAAGTTRRVLGFVLPWALFAALVFLLSTLLSFLSHWSYGRGYSVVIGAIATAAALFVSLLLRSSLRFINDSSVQAPYASRLARAYLGATNPIRAATPTGRNIAAVIPGDDVELRQYRPHEAGGPLHLINVTVNHTADLYSERMDRDRQGDALSVGPFGLTEGPLFHALWGPQPGQILPQNVEPNVPHPFDTVTPTEELTLQQWLAISGAAVGPGRGPGTTQGLSLLLGLVNARTGYWWDSGRRIGLPGGIRYRILDAIPRLFLPQFLLYYEFIGHFAGPWARYWYLSDGGFFENLGVYELIRRRVRHIVCCDADQDGGFAFDDLGNMIRKVRIDFQADVRFLTADELDALQLLPEVRRYLGTLDQLRPDTGTKLSARHAALAFVYYDGADRPRSVLLYIKTSMTGDEPADVVNFRADNPEFPHDPTLNQFFTEPQWESYRMLGDHIGSQLLLPGPGGRLWLTDLRPWA
jgi:choline dehydrogenase-like flavoprotein